MEKDINTFGGEENVVRTEETFREKELRKVILKQAKDIAEIKWYMRFFTIITTLGLLGALAVVLVLVQKFLEA